MKNCSCSNSYCGCAQPRVVSVQTTEGIKSLSGCFAYVASNNTCYFISECHEIAPISSGPVFVDNYDFATNPLSLANQTVYDFANNLGAVYNAKGEYRLIDLKEAA